MEPHPTQHVESHQRRRRFVATAVLGTSHPRRGGFRGPCPVLLDQPGQTRVRQAGRGLAVFVDPPGDRIGALVGCVISRTIVPKAWGRRVRDFTHRYRPVRICDWVGDWCVRARTLRLACRGATTLPITGKAKESVIFLYQRSAWRSFLSDSLIF